MLKSFKFYVWKQCKINCSTKFCSIAFQSIWYTAWFEFRPEMQRLALCRCKIQLSLASKGLCFISRWPCVVFYSREEFFLACMQVSRPWLVKSSTSVFLLTKSILGILLWNFLPSKGFLASIILTLIGFWSHHRTSLKRTSTLWHACAVAKNTSKANRENASF